MTLPVQSLLSSVFSLFPEVDLLEEVVTSAPLVDADPPVHHLLLDCLQSLDWKSLRGDPVFGKEGRCGFYSEICLCFWTRETSACFEGRNIPWPRLLIREEMCCASFCSSLERICWKDLSISDSSLYWSSRRTNRVQRSPH